MAAPERVGPILDMALMNLRKATEETIPSEMIRQSNIMLLELSKEPKAKKQDFIELVE